MPRRRVGSRWPRRASSTGATSCRRCAPSSARWSAPACSRSTPSTCCSAPTTCRCTPGWGRTTTTLLDRAQQSRARSPRRMVEYWAHVQALMPVDLWPVMQHRMAEHRARRGKWGFVAEAPDLEANLLAEVRDRGRLHRPGPRRRAAPQPGALGVELVEHPTGPRLPLHRRRPGHRGPQQPVRGALRPARAGDPGRGARAAPPRRSRRRTASWCAGRRARTGSPPARCLRDYYRMHVKDVRPAIEELVEDGELVPATDRRLGPTGVPAPRRPAAAPGRRPGAAQPLRPRRVGARARRAALRLPLPHRDLRAGGPARARLLRAAVPARATGSWPAWTSRPTGRPGGWW